MLAIRYVEHLIVRRAVADLLEAGFALDIYDNARASNPVLSRSTNVANIMAALFQSDDPKIVPIDGDGKPHGHVLLAFGLEGWDVIRDLTTNLEIVMHRSLDLGNEGSSAGEERGYVLTSLASLIDAMALPAPLLDRVQAMPDLVITLQAIAARRDGVWDHPALLAMGPLTASAEDDCARFARQALQKAAIPLN